MTKPIVTAIAACIILTSCNQPISDNARDHIEQKLSLFAEKFGTTRRLPNVSLARYSASTQRELSTYIGKDIAIPIIIYDIIQKEHKLYIVGKPYNIFEVNANIQIEISEDQYNELIRKRTDRKDVVCALTIITLTDVLAPRLSLETRVNWRNSPEDTYYEIGIESESLIMITGILRQIEHINFDE